MAINNLHRVAFNLDGLKNVLDQLEPKVRTFGGRHFVNVQKDQDFTLNHIVDCFSELSRNELQNKQVIKAIYDRVMTLDEACNKELSQKFILIRVATWIRHIVGTLFFNRQSRLEALQKLSISNVIQPVPASAQNISNLNNSAGSDSESDEQETSVAAQPSEPSNEPPSKQNAINNLIDDIHQQVTTTNNTRTISLNFRDFVEQLPKYLSSHPLAAQSILQRSDQDVSIQIADFLKDRMDIYQAFNPGVSNRSRIEFDRFCAMAAHFLRNEAKKVALAIENGNKVLLLQAESDSEIDEPDFSVVVQQIESSHEQTSYQIATNNLENKTNVVSAPNSDDNYTSESDEPDAQESVLVQQTPLHRTYPPFSLSDAVPAGDYHSDNRDLFEDQEILHQAEYIYAEEIAVGNATVYARLTWDGEWVIQQQAKKGCTAAATAMLIHDHNKEITLIDCSARNVNDWIEDLKKAGLEPLWHQWEQSPQNRMEILRELVEMHGSAIVEIDDKNIKGHVVVVDKVSEEGVSLRDPYHGWAVTVTLDAFDRVFPTLFNLVQVKKDPLQDSLNIDDFVMTPSTLYVQNLALLSAFDETGVLIKVDGDEKLVATDKPLNKHEITRLITALNATMGESNRIAIDTFLKLKKNKTAANLKSFEIAITNALTVFNAVKVIQAEYAIPQPSFSLLKATLKMLQRLYNSFDLVAKEFETAHKIANPFLSHLQENPANLEDFCARFCINMNVEIAIEMINKGKKLVAGVIDGTIESGNHEDLLHFTWFLMYKAIEKQQGFDSGAFAIEDGNQRLYQFLLKSKASSPVYARPSTHYANRSPKKHHGIDVFDELMPAKKRTLLFSMANNEDGSQFLFIKPENFSALISPSTAFDVWMHTVELFAAQRNKLLYPGSDDEPNMRKERVPSAVLKDFEKLLNVQPGIDKTEIRRKAKLYGITFMYRYVQNLDREYPEFDTQKFLSSLQEYDHLDKRTGREVYLTQPDLNN